MQHGISCITKVQLPIKKFKILGFNMRELSDKDYLLGLVGGGEQVRTINFVFLLAVFHIYRQRLFHDSLLDV